MDDRLTILPREWAAHSGKGGLNHPTHAEHVHVKHLPHLHFLTLLHCSEIADACVVDQHVDVTEAFLGRMDRGIDLSLICHVQFQSESVAIGSQILDVIGVSRSHYGAVTAFQNMRG